MEAEVQVALIAVAGALGGALIGAGASFFITLSQLTHADRTRWHADRRALYARVLAEARGLLRGYRRWHGHVGLDERPPIPSADAFEELVEEARLVASAVGQAVYRLQLLEVAMDQLWLSSRLMDVQAISDDWERWTDTVAEAIGGFRDAARVELGIDERRHRRWRPGIRRT